MQLFDPPFGLLQLRPELPHFLGGPVAAPLDQHLPLVFEQVTFRPDAESLSFELLALLEQLHLLILNAARTSVQLSPAVLPLLLSCLDLVFGGGLLPLDLFFQVRLRLHSSLGQFRGQGLSPRGGLLFDLPVEGLEAGMPLADEPGRKLDH